MVSLQAGLAEMARALDACGIEYLVGGSVASTLYGVARATIDVDLLAAMTPAQVDCLARSLPASFYADLATMQEGLRRGLAFNLIDVSSGYKFDVFPARTAFHREELARRQVVPITLATGETLTVPVATVEDILLAKLAWYREGGETSERQWRDVSGIVAVHGARLDRAYLERWAEELGVADLLGRVRGEW